MEPTIKPLSPSLADDFLKFFDGPAFADNPDWSHCYCCFFHIQSPGWEERTGAQNREFARDAIASGLMNGYLAYIDGEPVGWVNAGDRASFKRFEDEPLLKGKSVCSVVCFTIAHSLRRKGVAAALLNAVIDGAKGKYDFIEAYPLKGEQTAAMHYHGPLSMYEKAGFEVVGESEEYWVVRRRVSF